MSEFGPTWKSEVVPCQQIDGFFASEANIFSTNEDYWMWFCEYVDVKLAFLEEHVLQHDNFFFGLIFLADQNFGSHDFSYIFSVLSSKFQSQIFCLQ